MGNIYEIIHTTTGIPKEIVAKGISSLTFILISIFLRWILLWIVSKRTENSRIRYQWRKVSLYVVSVMLFFVVGRIWLKGIQSLATYFGLLSAGVAIALKDVLTNFVGWLFIISRRPFQVGERISIGEHSGDVVDQRIFQFTIMEIGEWVGGDQHTGRVVHVPNSMVFTHPQINYTQGWFDYIYDEAGVLVTFESNWQKAKIILEEIGQKHGPSLSSSALQKLKRISGKFLTLTPHFEPHVYTTVADSGVMLTLRYLCEPLKRREIKHNIWEDILKRFTREDDIDFAYPTQRFYNNAIEGKPGLKPEAHKDVS